jgi:acetyl esterase/lipase
LIAIRSNQRSIIFLSAVLLLLLDFHGVARVLAAEASLGRYRVVPIPRPTEDGGAILLPGKSENPVTETWSNIEGPHDAPWFTGTKFVRNVPQASITPFLPDPAKATGAAMIVAPGGGTVVLSMEREGYSVARWLNQRGIAAFVLKYRLVPTPADSQAFLTTLKRLVPPYDQGPPVISGKQASDEEAATLQDGVDAVRYLRRHASEFRISADRIGFMGFSAGAYTTLGVALKAHAESRPNLVAAIYGSMPYGLTVRSTTSPAFIVAATDDPQVPVMEALKTYTAWRQANIPVELHVFQSGGHGFGALPRHRGSDQWLDLFDRWLRENRFGGTGPVNGYSQR